MTVVIEQSFNVDIAAVLARSPVADAPDAEEIMKRYMLISDEVWKGSVSGEIACVFGLIAPSLLSDRGYLWLLTTDLCDEHKFLLVRHSQIWMKEVLSRYGIVYGDVMVDNHKAIRWLKWLGAKFHEKSGRWLMFEIEAQNG